MKTHLYLVLSTFLAHLAFLSGSGQVVTNVRDSGLGSLRWALTEVEEGGEITFSSEVLGRTIVLFSPLEFPDRVTNFSMAGPDRQIIISSPRRAVFSSLDKGKLQISGISFRDAQCIISTEIGTYCNIKNCSFRNIQQCFPQVRGDIFIWNSSFYKNGSVIEESSGKVSMIESTFDSNKGLIMGCSSRLESFVLRDCTVQFNQAPPQKGLFDFHIKGNRSATINISGSTFEENSINLGIIFRYLVQGGKNHQIDYRHNRVKTPQNRIMLCILDNDSQVELHPPQPTLEEDDCKTWEARNRKTGSFKLDDKVFSPSCEGSVIVKRSSEAKVFLRKSSEETNHPPLDCCLSELKIYSPK